MTVIVGATFALAAASGAVLRVGLDRLTRRRAVAELPVGILTVNVTGSFALGLVAGAVRSRGLDADVATVLGTGFCGAFTTFSTYTVDTVRLIARGHRRLALVNTVASLLLCLAAARGGFAVSG